MHTDTELAIVIGHTGCGAVTAAYDALQDDLSEPPGITHCIKLLTTYLDEAISLLPPDLTRTATVNRLVEYNVDRQIEHLQTSPDISDSVTLIGGVYDFQDAYSDRRGEVHLININGTNRIDELHDQYPAFTDRITRLWDYQH